MWPRRLFRSRSSEFGAAFSVSSAESFSGNGRATFFIPSQRVSEKIFRRPRRRMKFVKPLKNFYLQVVSRFESGHGRDTFHRVPNFSPPFVTVGTRSTASASVFH